MRFPSRWRPRSASGGAVAGSALLVAATAIWLVLAAVIPVNVRSGERAVDAVAPLRSSSTTRPALQPLIAQTAGVQLIRPAQALAAVKDDGAAEKMLKKLKLQGVTEAGGEMVAYLMVEKEGLKTVRQNQKVLEFTVDKIEVGRVTLNLRGVAVTLGHD